MSDSNAVAEADEDLTDMQRKFVDAYMGEAKGNGTQSCRLAGYAGADTVLATQACRMLRLPHIRRAIDARTECDPLVAGRLERLRFLTEIMRGEVTDEKLDKDGCRVEVRASTADRLKALEALSKAAGEHLPRPVADGEEGMLSGLTPGQILDLALQGKGYCSAWRSVNTLLTS